MKTGRAALFAQRVIRYQATYKKPRFATWADFRKTFIAEFTPRDERRSALARLETTGYYQGKRSVDDYVDEFRDLVELSSYTEGLAIVVKFWKGLNRDIQDVIASIPIGRPEDDDPEAWYSAALRAEENWRTNDLFHGPPRTNPKPTGGMFSTPWLVPATWTPKPTPQNPTPTGANPPRTKEVTPDACRRCGKPGHWAKDCEKCFDIRYMSTDEKEDWLQGVAIEADTRDLEDELEEEKGPERSPEDFQTSSG